MRIKKDDLVIVLSGSDKGKKGKVLRVIPDEGKVVVQNVSVAKRHTRPSKTKKGGIVSQESPIFAEKVMIYCPDCKEAVKMKTKILDNNERIRVCARCGEELDKK
ncbi:MAG: 50S ribosomal protein L24 [candidate division WS2 bacterium]|uniref:Large ribosomal subunit protein uL24 n=1 Tax=Psychracetigena formicireducens TaxID=2986056 RepID=A0A9E2BFJ7_PSYF1|nr:50S ribosomal protein L24 [Candidatus Psychracetigena formicireducens]MBT9144668.1 50S ribosomal protein L24 [Candidatus Psychracetigena formicireducens]MBT9150210.1 50S ribosomal protein L24 [Candidatus Psychracetigena formicireducens]